MDLAVKKKRCGNTTTLDVDIHWAVERQNQGTHEFDGTRENATSFIHNCRSTSWVKKPSFQPISKIAFALSYCKGGSVGTWSIGCSPLSWIMHQRPLPSRISMVISMPFFGDPDEELTARMAMDNLTNQGRVGNLHHRIPRPCLETLPLLRCRIEHHSLSD